MEEKQEKVIYLSTNGPESPEKAAVPFVLANAALAMDIEVTIALQGPAVYLAKKGFAKHVIRGGGFDPIEKLITDFLALGGKLLICVPCIKERNIEVDDLIEGAETTAAGKLTVQAIEADVALAF